MLLMENTIAGWNWVVSGLSARRMPPKPTASQADPLAKDGTREHGSNQRG
jgi:hypothetical protein